MGGGKKPSNRQNGQSRQDLHFLLQDRRTLELILKPREA